MTNESNDENNKIITQRNINMPTTNLEQQQQQLSIPAPNPYQIQNQYHPQQNNGFPYGGLFQNQHNNAINTNLLNNLSHITEQLDAIQNPLSGITEKLSELVYKPPNSLVNAPKTKTQNTQKAYKALLESFIKNNIGKIPIQPWDTGYKDVNNYINSIWDQFGESTEFSQDALKEINATMEILKQDFAKDKDKDDILKSANTNKDVIENLIKDPDKHKKNIISACDKIADGMVSTFTSFPGSFFFVLYNIIFRPITFFYYAYDAYLVNKKCKELKSMEPDDENRDKLLKDTLFLLTQMSNDNGDKLNCLFYTKSKKYGQIFQYQIDNGIDAMVKNLPIAKDITKKIENDLAQVANFGQLSALLLKHSSELTNKFNIEPNKVIKISWEDTTDDKGKDVRKFTIENVDKSDIAKNDNNLYIDNPAIKHLFKTMVDNNRSAKEDSDFGRNVTSIKESYEAALADENLNITNEILNQKIKPQEIDDFKKSINTLIENVKTYVVENTTDFGKISQIRDYMKNIEDKLDNVNKESEEQINSLKNKIESYYGGMFETLYTQSEKILDYNKDIGEHKPKEGLYSSDSYKDNIDSINLVIRQTTKYRDIIEFADAYRKQGLTIIDHIAKSNSDLKAYKEYAIKIKGIIDSQQTVIAGIKSDIETKFDILKRDNDFNFTKYQGINDINMINRINYERQIALDASAANRTKVIHTSNGVGGP